MRDKFSKALSGQQSLNPDNRGTKINIHFPLRGGISNYCNKLNEEIQKITKSEIDFLPKSAQVPHLTLYMGFVGNKQKYSEVMNELYSLAQEMSPIEIAIKKPCLVGPKRNYAFINTVEHIQITEIKRTIKDMTSKWIEPLNWDVVNEKPHITVAYIRDNFNEVEDLLHSYPTGPNWFGNCFEVSHVGPWGSCLGSIRTFEFP
jgi:2'-5' RNA ligase